jgi:hypothetical protein
MSEGLGAFAADSGPTQREKEDSSDLKVEHV